MKKETTYIGICNKCKRQVVGYHSYANTGEAIIKCFCKKCRRKKYEGEVDWGHKTSPRIIKEILEKLYYDKVDYRSNVTIEIALNALHQLILKQVIGLIGKDEIDDWEKEDPQTFNIVVKTRNGYRTELRQKAEKLWGEKK